MKYVFITDLHFQETSSVRTGSILEDLEAKLHYVVDYTNSIGGILLLGGDIFHRPSVTDTVKSTIIKELIRLDKTPYAIPGNHDILYNNDKYLYRTSYNVLVSAGIVKNLVYEEFEDHILTSQVPLTSKGKPQVCIFHGFLNIEDGRNTFRFTDIDTDDRCLVMLGHDHSVYDPIEYRNTTILRAGSFLRDSRQESSFRIPNMIEVTIDNGSVIYNLVPIKCRSSESIFKEKEVQVKLTYDFNTIIDQLKNTTTGDLTLNQALQKVVPKEHQNRIIGYIMNLL